MFKKGFFLFLVVGILSYFFLPVSKHPTRIPVFFTSKSFAPIINAEIDGEHHLLLVDTGMSTRFSLEKNILDQTHASLLNKIEKTYDFRGNEYNSPIYVLQNIRIGSTFLKTCEASEESPHLYLNTSLWANSRRPKPLYNGRIGRKFFENSCVLFDFPKSAIFVENDVEKLKKSGVFNQKNFHQVPFFINKGIIHTTIETDLGQHKIIFDTGASFCMLNNKIVPPEQIIKTPSGKTYFHSSKFLINGCNFFDWSFGVIEITDLLEVDGIIGVDFFLEHAVCFDFHNNVAYIQKPGNYIATQWQRGRYYLTQFYLKHFTDLSRIEEL